jgi:Leucine-rich repeat (LRR) protein
MSGTLPSSIWTLSSLLSLQMNDNPNLIVRFDEILNAKTLESLSVSRTGMRSLKGLEGAAKLKDLVADGNSLTGTFPEQLLSLRDIEKISLGQNLLFGKLPTRLGELTNLKVLDLFSNDFFSTIPSELSRLNGIETLGTFPLINLFLLVRLFF